MKASANRKPTAKKSKQPQSEESMPVAKLVIIALVLIPLLTWFAVQVVDFFFGGGLSRAAFSGSQRNLDLDAMVTLPDVQVEKGLIIGAGVIAEILLLLWATLFRERD